MRPKASSQISLPALVQSKDQGQLENVLKRELEQVEGDKLLLQQGLTQSGYTDGKGFRVSVLKLVRGHNRIQAKVGVFYKGIIAGCNCADDPSPVPEVNEYCELSIVVDTLTGDARVSLVEQGES